MYKDSKMQSLFDDINIDKKTNELPSRSEQKRPELPFQDVLNERQSKETSKLTDRSEPEVVKIVWFFENNSFEEFIPRR
jgi:hypothetical protein